MTNTWDAIVVGGGHNGLVAAFYLARAGLRTLVLERRGVIGGAAVTEEFHPGFRASSASYVVSLLHPKVIADLALKRHGFVTLPLAGSFAPRLDGSSLLQIGEETHDRAEMARFSNRDYDAQIDFHRVITALSDVLRGRMLQAPPPLSGGGLADAWGALKLGNELRRLSPELRHRFIQLFATGVGHMLDRWFDSDVVKVKYASSATAGSFVSLYQPGSAINLLHLSIGEIDGKRGAWALARGGMGAITGAMAKAAEEAGATIRVSSPVASLLMAKDRAVGVRLASGEEARARVVLANTDPRTTFLGLVGEDRLDPRFAADIKSFRAESATFRMNLALDGVPEFAARPGADLGIHHRCFMALTPAYAAFEDAYRAASAGEIPDEPIIDAHLPSAVDDSMTPPGRHVLSILAQHFPYRLSRGRSWDDEKDKVADLIVERIARFVPNLKRLVVGRLVLSPLDLERTFGLAGGDVYHGRLDPDQMFSLRPHPLAARYATPVAGLYLCGAGTHPGGGVSGAPGHNAAHRVLKDLGRN